LVSIELLLFMKKKETILKNKLKYIAQLVEDVPLVVRYGHLMYDVDSESYNELANRVLEVCDLTDHPAF
jgi:hypothetical protein